MTNGWTRTISDCQWSANRKRISAGDTSWSAWAAKRKMDCDYGKAE
ncbi:MAG: hypothetical protein ACLRMN_07490 [Mediterraneibacter gnavus]